MNLKDIRLARGGASCRTRVFNVNRSASTLRGFEDSKLENLLRVYQETDKPVEVDFHELAPLPGGTDRFTHLIHPYPAKLLQNIPSFFLRCSSIVRPGGVVFDPFCGSGTVLLESSLAGLDSIGVDLNPIATLIASVKVRRLSPEKCSRLLRNVHSRYCKVEPGIWQGQLNYWFPSHVLTDLSRLARAVARVRSDQYKRFFEVCLSATIRKVSLANPRLSVPVRLKAENYPPGHWFRAKAEKRLSGLQSIDALQVFSQVVEANIARMRRLPERGLGEVEVRCEDAREACIEQKYDLILTSPPYAGAQKYIRATSLELAWVANACSKTIRELKDRSIGREKFKKSRVEQRKETGIPHADALLDQVADLNPLRACIAATYLTEMRVALSNAVEGLAEGGSFVLVSGPTHVTNHLFNVPKFLRTILCEELGLQMNLELIDTIRSRGLMTARNRTSNIISREHVHWFTKPVKS